MGQEAMIDENGAETPEVVNVDTDTTEPEASTEQATEATEKDVEGIEAAPMVKSERPPEIIMEREHLNALWDVAGKLADTDFVPERFRGKREQCFAAILQGRALGLDVMTSLREVWMSPQGSPELSAEVQAGLVRKRGHRIEGTSDGTKAKLTGTRKDTGEEMTITFTLDDAVAQGLVELKDGKPYARSKSGKPLPWERHTEAMLWHRATTTLVRRLFPDVLIGDTP